MDSKKAIIAFTPGSAHFLRSNFQKQAVLHSWEAGMPNLYNSYYFSDILPSFSVENALQKLQEQRVDR